MISTDPLSNRVVSAFPISIATSLALESIFYSNTPSYDPDREIPQKVNITDYDEFWINLSTMFRNIMGALSKDDLGKVGASGLKETLAFEMETIESIVFNEGGNKVKVIFYACEYKEATSSSKHPHAVFRTDSTDKQKIYRSLHNETIAKLLKERNESDNLKILDSELKPKHKCRALVLTHIAYDLLSYKNFNHLDLIESHTGVLKPKSLWYTKFHEGKSLNFIPFNLGFLQIFGDNEHFKPIDIRVRRTLIELAKQDGWTQVSTLPRILQSISYLKDHFTKEVLTQMLRE